MVKQLLKSKKATPAVLEFLATSTVDKRQRVQEQKPKERRKRREEVWRLDEERVEGEGGVEESGGTGGEEDSEGREKRGGE